MYQKIFAEFKKYCYNIFCKKDGNDTTNVSVGSFLSIGMYFYVFQRRKLTSQHTGQRCSERELSTLMAFLDKDKNGAISENEFLHFFLSDSPQWLQILKNLDQWGWVPSLLPKWQWLQILKNLVQWRWVSFTSC